MANEMKNAQCPGSKRSLPLSIGCRRKATTRSVKTKILPASWFDRHAADADMREGSRPDRVAVPLEEGREMFAGIAAV